jgi:uncharacterized protein
MNSIRNLFVSMVVAAGVITSANVQAQSGPAPYIPRGIPNVATQQQQDEALALVAAYLQAWSAEDPSSYPVEQFVSDDAVFEYPYADEASRRIEGREAIAQALSKTRLAASNWKFTGLRLFQTLELGVFFVEYKASAYVPATQRSYESRYVARVTVRGGKISNYLELWERDASATAFGVTGSAR